MIEYVAAFVLTIMPMPMQEQALTIKTANIQAAREAREIPARWQSFTTCISERESGHSYRARNSKSSAQGRYQFLDSQWREGGAWNVWKRLKSYGYNKDVAKAVRERLMVTEIANWRPVYQDVLYAQVLLSGEGNGWRHWYASGSRCNTLVPSNK